MKEKNILLGVIVILVVVIVISFIVTMSNKNNAGKYVEVQDDGVKVNNSEQLNSTKTYNGLEFTNVKFSSNGSLTSLYAEVKNTTSQDTEKERVSITVLDVSGNEITTFNGNIDEIKAGETLKFNAQIMGDYADAYDIKISAVK